MTMQLLTGALSPVTVSATTANSGYPATNILTSQIKRPWQSTSVAVNNVIIDLGSSQYVYAIALQDINAASSTIKADNSATPTTFIGNLVGGMDNQGRYKGTQIINATVRYISITPGSVTDARGYYNIGAAYVFSAGAALPKDALYGDTSIDHMSPQIRVDLDNGRPVRSNTGPEFESITLGFAGKQSDDIESLKRNARAAICWLDFGIAASRGLQWPVQANEDKTTRKIDKYNRELVEILLMEVV